jgi:hypothetical protein
MHEIARVYNEDHGYRRALFTDETCRGEMQTWKGNSSEFQYTLPFCLLPFAIVMQLMTLEFVP